MQVPDVVGEVIGWKALRLTPSLTLHSPVLSLPWPSDEYTHANCRMEASPQATYQTMIFGSHQAPEQECTCGIYAVATPKQTAQYLHPDCVLAEVALSGKVVPGERGWRAERARVKALTCVVPIASRSKRLIERCAEVYGVPIRDDLAVEEIAEELTLEVTVTTRAGLRKIFAMQGLFYGGALRLRETVKLGPGDSFSVTYKI